MRSSSALMLSSMLLMSLFMLLRRAANAIFWLSMISFASGKTVSAALTSSGQRISGSSRISVCSLASIAESRTRRRNRRCSSARAAVSSRSSKIWPGSTTSPSRTYISRITPPSKCWMILFCPVATNTPEATTAPAIGAVLPQTPKPISATARIRMPPTVGHLVDRGRESYQVPSDTAVRAAISLLAITYLVPENPSRPLRIQWRRLARPARDVGRLAAGNDGNDLVAGAECLHRPLVKYHDLVDALQQCCALRDRHHRHLFFLGAQQRLGKRPLAVRIQIRVWFVEHDQPRIAVKRACQPDPLPLAARQRCAIHADDGLIALREARDHLVDVGGLGRIEH